MEKVSVFLSDWQVLFREGIHFTLSGEEDMDVIGETTTNEEALVFIEKNPPRIAIVNANHSEFTGIQLTSRIQQNLPAVSAILIMDSDNEEWLFDDILFEGKLTSIETPSPREFKLNAKNYPNPFNPGTVIQYSSPTNSMVRLVVYNIQGKEVATLVNENKLAGSYTVNFDGSDLSSGMYLYTLTTNTGVISNKMLLIK